MCIRDSIYMHLDGQPVDPKKWNQENPFIPVYKIKDNESFIDYDSNKIADIDYKTIEDKDIRIFARASSDAKGPVMMLIQALKFMNSNNINQKLNLKLVMDFEEEKGSPSLPETEAITEGIYKKTIAETLMDPNNDSVSEEYKVEDHDMFTTTFTRESWGLGTVGLKMVNLPPSGGEFIMVNASCPVDNSNSILRWSMRVSKDIEDELGMAIIDGIANGVLDDMPIWDNKSYVSDPILCDGDGPINKFRKWVSQFYSVPLQN